MRSSNPSTIFLKNDILTFQKGVSGFSLISKVVIEDNDTELAVEKV